MPWSRSNSYDTVPTNQGNPNPHRTLKRAESRVDKFKRLVDSCYLCTSHLTAVNIGNKGNQDM